jgi:sortase A
MSVIYKKKRTVNTKKIGRFMGLALALIGGTLLMYLLFPLISWQIYFEPVFASQGLATPIPKITVMTQNTITSLIKAEASSLAGVDYNNAQNWYPTINGGASTARSATYTISIPKINVTDAVVSTVDTDLKSHLVQYAGTPQPPDKGNTVIFGHSTLPQLFNPKDYTTIFANLHKIVIGDQVIVKSEGVTYTYKIVNISVVDPEDTSVLAQTPDTSYITIITCTPPGTVWKRLIVKAQLQNL